MYFVDFFISGLGSVLVCYRYQVFFSILILRMKVLSISIFLGRKFNISISFFMLGGKNEGLIAGCRVTQ